jgi:hypothetical protein
MKIIRVFPKRTSFTPNDSLSFVGDPPLFRPDADEIHVSATFTWDIEESQRLAEAWRQYYPIARLGGPAFDACPNGFTPGMYVKRGVTFTTRGCNNFCPWCLVWRREGKLVEYRDFAPGYIIQDNNLLQASKWHVARVFEMLKSQRRAAVFSGGLDSRLIDDWTAEGLRGLRIEQLFLAADTKAALRPLEKALKKLAPLGRRKLRVYVLIGYDGETISDATERLEKVWHLGGLPFAQLFQPPEEYIDYSDDWKHLARLFARPAAMYSYFKERGERMPDE